MKKRRGKKREGRVNKKRWREKRRGRGREERREKKHAKHEINAKDKTRT